MAQISTIKYSDVLEARRYDAEYFKPEYLAIEKEITTIGYLELGNKKASLLITDGDHGNPEYSDDKNDICYIKVEQLGDIDIELFNSPRVTKACVKYQSKTNFTEKFDILLSMKGTIGKTCIVIDETPAILNRDVAKIQINKELLNPFYVLVYFKTRLGKSFTEKFASGAVQRGLYLNKIQKIKIPLLSLPFQSQIEDSVKEAHQKQTESKQLYQEAEELLLTEIGLSGYKVKNVLAFETTRKEIDKAGRYDSEYFQPKYEEIIEKIEKYEGGWDFVKNQFKQNTTLSKKDTDYCNYIEIGDINVSNGEITPTRREAAEIPANGKRKLFKNDLLISKVRPYRGAISFVDFDMENLLGSGAFTVLQEKTDYKKEVLMVFLKTVYIKGLLLRYNCGTSYPVIKDEDILNLKIPLVGVEVQKQIAAKIQESHKLRKESKELLEEAKKKVEEEIEKLSLVGKV